MNIFLCESISSEAKSIVGSVYKVETNFCDSINQNRKIKDIINALEDNIPTFSGARFFVIKKVTILRIWSGIITFLIVLIQFSKNQNSP